MRTQSKKGLRHSPASTVSSPLFQCMLQFKTLSSLRQQGTDLGEFALEFSGGAKGLGFNDAAFKDLLNPALDEPLNWWRMSGLDHLTFGAFVEFLICQGMNAAAPPEAASPMPLPHRSCEPEAATEAVPGTRARYHHSPGIYMCYSVQPRARSGPGPNRSVVRGSSSHSSPHPRILIFFAGPIQIFGCSGPFTSFASVVQLPSSAPAANSV
ncbi:hypothetical protein DPX16_20750 [Anabarilius grahami]|uniref:Uncharacterized protein n=1 Tax=Anabarilius grahami TaxID=495550 RepID=A0A3N0YF79_ANAGA|nr:hypothetical protein DPX16_20750 [Anabarilius grahami]